MFEIILDVAAVVLNFITISLILLQMRSDDE